MPLLLFLREDNQEHLLRNLAVKMSIPRTGWAALPYLIQFSAMVAECLQMETIKNEVCLGLLTAQPPHPCSLICTSLMWFLRKGLYVKAYSSSQRTKFKSQYILPGFTITDFLTDLPDSALVSLKLILYQSSWYNFSKIQIWVDQFPE